MYSRMALTWTNTSGLAVRKDHRTSSPRQARRAARPDRHRPADGMNHDRSPINLGNSDERAGAWEIVPGLKAMPAFGLFVAVCVSKDRIRFFSADAWNKITHRRRGEGSAPPNIRSRWAGQRSRDLGSTCSRTSLLVTRNFDDIQHAAERSGGDGDGSTRSSHGLGVTIMAIGIIISTSAAPTCSSSPVHVSTKRGPRDGLFSRRRGGETTRRCRHWADSAGRSVGGVSRAGRGPTIGDELVRQ